MLISAGPGTSHVTYTFPNFNLDLTATGGTSQFLRQNSSGGAIDVIQPAFSMLSGSAVAAQLPNAGVHTGDATGTFPAVTVAKVNGVSSAASPSNHTVQVVTASNTRTDKVMPNCTDTGGQHINFDQSTDLFGCGTSSSGGGGGGSTNLSASGGTITQTGSNLQLVSIASVPTLAAGACWNINLTTDTSTTTYNAYLYVDGSQVAQFYSGGGSGLTVLHSP